MGQFTYGDLFAGVGMLGLACEFLGGDAAFHCEIDPFCREVLAKRWPGVPLYGDIRELTGEEVRRSMGRRNMAAFEERRAMYESGMSLEQVAEACGVSRQSVWDMLSRAGVEMRPQQRHGSENHFFRGGARSADSAHHAVEGAVDSGDLTRPDVCEKCGSGGVQYRDGRSAIQAHHDDYNYPLRVRWLCQGCHHEWHQHHHAIPVGVMPAEAPDLDVLVGGFP